ncbi:MAG: SDR family NAD(P)-dependent oxidoreductase [Chitinophagaceae bacterium]
MKTSGNTILITGGSAGIGFETAKLFLDKGNKVIITGRNKNRLQEAAAKLPGVVTVVSDVNDAADTDALVNKLQKEFPSLNLVINNAGYAEFYKLDANPNAFEKASNEILTNYLAIVRLTEKLLPLLSKQTEAAVVNVSSIVAIAPNHGLPTYAASKAALHSYSQSLRITLSRNSHIKVFELMPPLVNTDFSKEIGGANGIPPQAVAQDLLEAIESNNYEIHTGNTAQIYDLYLSSPQQALAAMNAN